MKINLVRVLVGTMAIVVAAVLTAIPLQAQSLAIVDATIFPDPETGPIEKGVILVEDGKITAVGLAGSVSIPDGIETVRASGQFVVAGYWNSHVHYTGKLEAAATQDGDKLGSLLSDTFLQWGFANTVDTGSFYEKTLAIRDRIRDGEVAGPRIITAAGSFVPKGGSPYYIKPITLPEFESAERAAAMVRAQLDAGAEAIKLFTGSWATPDTVVVMEPDHVRAATRVAHDKEALVFAHPSDSDGARVAIENGVDILAHTYPAEIKGPWDKSLPGKMAERGMSLIPTLKLFRPELTRAGLPAFVIDQVEDVAVEQTRISHDAGVEILFGTDVGYMEDADTTEEFRLMGAAGLNHQDILASLTTSPAARYGFGDTSGRVAPGYDGDLVLLGNDPRDDITAFANVLTTIRGGKVIYER